MSVMCAVNSVRPNYYYNYYGYPPQQPENRTQNASKAVVTGGLLYLLTLGLNKGSKFFADKLMRGKEFTEDKQVVHDIAQNMVDKNGLKVKLGYINEQNKHLFGSGPNIDAVAKGQNAFYDDIAKMAVAPKERPSLMLHELGHAINAKKGGILKLLQKSRKYAPYAPMALLMLNGAFGKKDNKKGFFEKYALPLGFAAFLPTVIEEGIASIRGINAAKVFKNLDLRPLKRNYRLAWLTYLISGIGLGIAAKQASVQQRL